MWSQSSSRPDSCVFSQWLLSESSRAEKCSRLCRRDCSQVAAERSPRGRPHVATAWGVRLAPQLRVRRRRPHHSLSSQRVCGLPAGRQALGGIEDRRVRRLGDRVDLRAQAHQQQADAREREEEGAYDPHHRVAACSQGGVTRRCRCEVGDSTPPRRCLGRHTAPGGRPRRRAAESRTCSARRMSSRCRQGTSSACRPRRTPRRSRTRSLRCSRSRRRS